jgi:hypothetical protein
MQVNELAIIIEGSAEDDYNIQHRDIVMFLRAAPNPDGSNHWMRHNQKNIRAECYAGLADANSAGDIAGVGKKIILAPSFMGGPREMNAAYQDSMSMVREFGKPHFFITMTTFAGRRAHVHVGNGRPQGRPQKVWRRGGRRAQDGELGAQDGDRYAQIPPREMPGDPAGRLDCLH